jgi:arsenate reductase
MAEIGIDISKYRSKSVNEFLGIRFDYVVTVCDQAKETCPFFPGGTKSIHKSFADPSNFIGCDDEILNAFRKLRDEIKRWIKQAFGQDINSTYN